jgi:hypothetical protein
MQTAANGFATMLQIYKVGYVSQESPINIGLRGIAAVGMALGILLGGWRLVPVSGATRCIPWYCTVCTPVEPTHGMSTLRSIRHSSNGKRKPYSCMAHDAMTLLLMQMHVPTAGALFAKARLHTFSHSGLQIPLPRERRM